MHDSYTTIGPGGILSVSTIPEIKARCNDCNTIFYLPKTDN